MKTTATKKVTKNQCVITEESYFHNKKIKVDAIELPFIIKLDNDTDFNLLKHYNQSIANHGSYTIDEHSQIAYGSVGGYICSKRNKNNKAWTQIYKVFEIVEQQLCLYSITFYRNFLNTEIAKLNYFIDSFVYKPFWLRFQRNCYNTHLQNLKKIIDYFTKYQTINSFTKNKKEKISKDWSNIIVPLLINAYSIFNLLGLSTSKYDSYVGKIRSIYFGFTFINHLEMILKSMDTNVKMDKNLFILKKKKIITSFLNFFVEQDDIMKDISLFKFSKKPLNVFKIYNKKNKN